MKFTISTKADIDGKSWTGVQITGLKAGEDLEACTPCTIKADAAGMRRVFAAKAGDVFHGITSPRKAYAGEAITVLGDGYRFHADDAAGLSAGDLFGLTAVAREADTASTTPVFRAVSKRDLQVIVSAVKTA
ncbi:hypothetical protein [Deinococcus fonticola]|uniref:hypothetical protein n=1 Tax=Deinococcus fonticola TaxID=2528713 RepID=UPI0010753FFC|nr:hypothetical protein [Deinococcus fonticola]